MCLCLTGCVFSNFFYGIMCGRPWPCGLLGSPKCNTKSIKRRSKLGVKKCTQY